MINEASRLEPLRHQHFIKQFVWDESAAAPRSSHCFFTGFPQQVDASLLLYLL